eukprot:CCRYP_015789-RA/>CCRYP_015789-RA protein AED:0.48 eAED:0.44 QI:0/-1/0/1/-1/1/1/0/97
MTETLAAAKYAKANLDNIVEKCIHLDAEQKEKLLAILRKHKDLFQGNVGIGKANPYPSMQSTAQSRYGPDRTLPLSRIARSSRMKCIANAKLARCGN